MKTAAKKPAPVRISSADGKAILDALNGPIHSTWQMIGHDVSQCAQEMRERVTNAGAIESCIDANRLQDYGGSTKEKRDAAEKALNACIDKHGLDAVMRYLTRHIHLV